MEEAVIVLLIFGTIFGIFYLFVSSRNKERMALIEKGADASIFYSKRNRVTPVWKVIILNLALLLMGIGLGVFIGGMLDEYSSLRTHIAMPASIFFTAGLGLFVGFNMTKNLDKEES